MPNQQKGDMSTELMSKFIDLNALLELEIGRTCLAFPLSLP